MLGDQLAATEQNYNRLLKAAFSTLLFTQTDVDEKVCILALECITSHLPESAGERVPMCIRSYAIDMVQVLMMIMMIETCLLPDFIQSLLPDYSVHLSLVIVPVWLLSLLAKVLAGATFVLVCKKQLMQHACCIHNTTLSSPN